MERDDEASPFINADRDYRTFEMASQNVLVHDEDVWDEVTNEWIKNRRAVNQFNDFGLEVSTRYLWNDTSQEYELSEKYEYDVNDNQRLITVADYDPDLEEFIPDLDLNYYFNVDGNIGTGYRFILRHENNDLTLLDSASYTHNEQNDYYEFIAHSASTGFVPRYKNVYTYNSDGRPVTQDRSLYNEDTEEFDPQYSRYWYYSTIDISSDLSELESINIDLMFQNPSSNSDHIQVVGENNLELYDCWITNQNGAIVSSNVVRTGDQITLEDIEVAGMYYVTLFGKAGQKTWKLLIQ